MQLMRRQCFSDPEPTGNREIRGDRAWAPNIAMVITDGESNVQEQQTIPKAKQAKRNGVRIIAIGVTDNTDSVELRGIASDPTKDVFNVINFRALNNILNSIIVALCPTPAPG